MLQNTNEDLGPNLVLASLLSAYPDAGFSENVALLLADCDPDRAGEVLKPTLIRLREVVNQALSRPEGIDDLRSEYIDLFDRGKEVTSLYETEYGRERALVKGNELVDIAGFYRAFGFETGGDGVVAEMVDHIAVELEFYALLVLKTQILKDASDDDGVSIVLDARKKFLQSHLGRFVGAIGERPGVQRSPFYSAVFAYCAALVQEECRRLEITVEPENWISSDAADAPEITCGGSVGCVK